MFLCQAQLSKFDEHKFVDRFFKHNLNFHEDTVLSLNSKFDLFYQNVSPAPVTNMNKQDIKLHEKPWFTPKTQKLILIDFYKDLIKKYIQNGEYLFKKLQNRFVDEIRSTRINQFN